MKVLLLSMLLLCSCITTEYHAASPLTSPMKLDVEKLNEYDIEYLCPKQEDKLLCTYAERLLARKGYVSEDESSKRNLVIELRSKTVKSLGSGTFDFTLWLLSILAWPYEDETFYEVEMKVTSSNKKFLNSNFYAHYSSNYSWIYALTQWTSRKLSDEDKDSTEDAGSKDLYKFIENNVAQALQNVEMGTI